MNKNVCNTQVGEGGGGGGGLVPCSYMHIYSVHGGGEGACGGGMGGGVALVERGYCTGVRWASLWERGAGWRNDSR